MWGLELGRHGNDESRNDGSWGRRRREPSRGNDLKSSCGKWKTLVKKRVISESNIPAVFGAAFILPFALISQIKHSGYEQMSQICRSAGQRRSDWFRFQHDGVGGQMCREPTL